MAFIISTSSRHSDFYTLSLAAHLGYSLCLGETTEGSLVSPIQVTFNVLRGTVPPLPPCLTQPSSLPSPLRLMGEGLPGPQCLSEQKSLPKH